MKHSLNSNTEWKQWGEDDPLWGVSSWSDKRKDGKFPWTTDEFYAVGKSDWQEFLTQWRNYGLDTQSCIEIGCGAGRITRFLSLTFDRVFALDVSEHMIALARAASGPNVEFSLVDGIHIPLENGSVTAVFSTHVLQHLDSVEDGFSYFRETFRTLKPGGTLMVHLPLYQFPGDNARFADLWNVLYRWFRRLDDFRSDARRRAGVKIVRMTPYPIRSLVALLTELGFKDVQIRIFQTTVNTDVHPFVLATR